MRESVRIHPARALELAASLTLALAFAINLLATKGLQYDWRRRRPPSAFVGISVDRWWRALRSALDCGIASACWTNYWVISGLLLGLGQEFSLDGDGLDAALGIVLAARRCSR